MLYLDYISSGSTPLNHRDKRQMTSRLVQKLTNVRDLKKILETTVRELGDTFSADNCQVVLSNPLDPNITSICEFQADDEEPVNGGSKVTVPLVLQGRTFGSVSVSRQTDLSLNEVNDLRVLLGELGDIIRLAQINDVVQRDTFRETFLVEIGNVMSYSLGIGDALFMVVNILGQALAVSRCLFICTDDAKAGWKCYEFWKQAEVKSCQDYYWPSNDSPFVAQALLSKMPFSVYEGQENSYVSPVQDELRFIGVKSMLGVPLTSSEGTHGCVILQQCDYRRAWTRAEVDMVQNVADKVAEALLKLPAEKRVREPIMQLHQRIVEAPTEGAGQSSVDRRRALKGALGQQAIPSARAIPKPAKAAPPSSPAAAPAAAPAPATSATAAVPPAALKPEPKTSAPVQDQANLKESTVAKAAPDLASQAALPKAIPPTELPVELTEEELKAKARAERKAKKAAEEAMPSPTIKPVSSARTSDNLVKPLDQESGYQSTTGIKQFSLDQAGAVAKETQEVLPFDPTVAPPAEVDPYADLDFGDIEEIAVATTDGAAAVTPAASAPVSQDASVVDTTGAETAPLSPVQAEEVAPEAVAPLEEAVVDQAPQSAGDVAEVDLGDLDSIPTPSSVAPKLEAPAKPSGLGQGWGNLDAIPTPSKGAESGAGGLKGSMLARAKASSAPSPLMSSLRKSAPPAPAAAAPVEAPPPEPLDEEAAQKKIDALMSASNSTSDYIFATPGLDPRMLGRIDGWVTQIEEKDKYKNGHARQVAEYAVAIAEQMKVKEEDVSIIRQAALVHDLGKLGIAKAVLQKGEDTLKPDEYVLKMGHSVAGADLLESFPDLAHLAPLVRAHHEEMDGEGFPQGLKGDEIPVYARIIAVANGYHELVADKIFEEGLNPKDAQEQIVEEAGKLFDSTVVEALIQAIKDGKVPEAM